MLASFAVTAKLICTFVFAYADCWFSHGAALFLFMRGGVRGGGGNFPQSFLFFSCYIDSLGFYIIDSIIETNARL